MAQREHRRLENTGIVVGSLKQLSPQAGHLSSVQYRRRPGDSAPLQPDDSRIERLLFHFLSWCLVLEELRSLVAQRSSLVFRGRWLPSRSSNQRGCLHSRVTQLHLSHSRRLCKISGGVCRCVMCPPAPPTPPSPPPSPQAGAASEFRCSR